MAAGLGLKEYSDASACNRTRQSYAELVARQEKLRLLSFACSGATTSSGILGIQQVNGLDVSPQLDQLFALKQAPKLITLTIGANDMGWTELLTKCATASCGSDEDTALVDGRLSVFRNNLESIAQRLREHYGAKLPRVVVTGYYQLLPSLLQSCPEMTGLTADELTWERAQETKLNDAIMSVVGSEKPISFAAVDFTGHESCTSTAWVQGINADAPFHPTLTGQQAYQKAVQ